MDEAPVISILMGVLNCECTLDESLACLEAQTETRWELIVCDDGSSDGSADVLRKWQKKYPKKITFLQNAENRGLAHTLNRCLASARGAFIARMDGDDLCSPSRFERELAFLDAHHDLSIVSTDMQCFDEDGSWGLRSYPTEPEPEDLVHGTPFCHAACMVRIEAFRAVNGYSESAEFERVEDYELWVRMMAAGFRGANIHEPLYQMRDDRNAAGRRKWKYRLNEARVRCKAVKCLELPALMYIYALRPLVLGLLPPSFSLYLHRRKLKKGRS